MFQRVHKNATGFVHDLRATGKKSIFVMADYFPTEMPHVCDQVIVISDVLKDLLVQDGISANKVTVIPDAVETDHTQCKNHSDHANQKIKVVWVGNEGHWETINVIKEALNDPKLSHFELVTISAHKEAMIPWRLDTIWNDILACDIAVIPADITKDESQAKSNNRLTMFKALGIPVICSPLSTYRKIINHGVNGFFAESLQGWQECLYFLKDRDTRQRIGLKDRDRIFHQYGLPTIAGMYKDIITKVLHAKR